VTLRRVLREFLECGDVRDAGHFCGQHHIGAVARSDSSTGGP
jgi:hypothetical protein